MRYDRFYRGMSALHGATMVAPAPLALISSPSP